LKPTFNVTEKGGFDREKKRPKNRRRGKKKKNSEGEKSKRHT